jgi:hypothetical protein
MPNKAGSIFVERAACLFAQMIGRCRGGSPKAHSTTGRWAGRQQRVGRFSGRRGRSDAMPRRCKSTTVFAPTSSLNQSSFPWCAPLCDGLALRPVAVLVAFYETRFVKLNQGPAGLRKCVDRRKSENHGRWESSILSEIMQRIRELASRWASPRYDTPLQRFCVVVESSAVFFLPYVLACGSERSDAARAFETKQ